MANEDVIIPHRALRDALQECLELQIATVSKPQVNQYGRYKGIITGMTRVQIIRLIWKSTGEIITEAEL